MNEKIKILYVITQGEWGGAQRYVFDLTTKLDSNQYEITVAIGCVSEYSDLGVKLALYTNIKVNLLQHLVRNISPLQDLLAIFELKKLYKKIKPDIIHLNSSKASVVGSLLNLNQRIVYTVHGWQFNESISILKRLFYWLVELIASSPKQKIIVLSKKEFTSAPFLISRKKLSIIQHGIAMPRFKGKSEARAEICADLGIPEDNNNFWFGTIANCYDNKGIDILLYAIKKSQDNLQNVKFFVIGGGPKKEDLMKLAYNELRILNEHVFFTGRIVDAANLLYAFDCFVLPSRKEGLPYAILESMAAQVPIIATRVGGIPSLIEDKKSGLLVKPDSVSELAEALVYAVEHPEEMKAMAKNAPSPTSLEQMVMATSSLYLKLLAQRQR